MRVLRPTVRRPRSARQQSEKRFPTNKFSLVYDGLFAFVCMYERASIPKADSRRALRRITSRPSNHQTKLAAGALQAKSPARQSLQADRRACSPVGSSDGIGAGGRATRERGRRRGAGAGRTAPLPIVTTTVLPGASLPTCMNRKKIANESVLIVIIVKH